MFLGSFFGGFFVSWSYFKDYCFQFPSLGLCVDLSRAGLPEGFLGGMDEVFVPIFEQMDRLEGGELANVDEGRRVGHYWLRASNLAPSSEIRAAIEGSLEAAGGFADAVRRGRVRGQGGSFRHLLCVGIGGSSLGTELLARALIFGRGEGLSFHCLDNTDPDGIDEVLGALEGELGRTLVCVSSKSGATAETRNGMLEVKCAYERAGLCFQRHVFAITEVGSKLDRYAVKHRWLERFPMWDYVGGRNSVLGPVGMVPAALLGLDTCAILEGARDTDEWTRRHRVRENPAALLAATWYCLGDGVGSKNMVILPYRDRLALLARYLQQLVMESLGKELDFDGNVVHQGMTVYGNKGSTDQHAYVQQLRDGLADFFVTFIEVLGSEGKVRPKVEGDFESGDFLMGFLLGTCEALGERGRPCLTLTLERLGARELGVLIALYERAVGFYALLIGVNAYHQPGVEAGKEAARAALKLQGTLVKWFKQHPGEPVTVETLAEQVGESSKMELIFKILRHLSANEQHKLAKSPSSSFNENYTYEP